MPYEHGGSRCVRLIEGNRSDGNGIDLLLVEAGSTYVANRSLIAFERPCGLHMLDLFFVIGTKSSLNVRRIRLAPAECARGIIGDKAIAGDVVCSAWNCQGALIIRGRAGVISDEIYSGCVLDS